MLEETSPVSALDVLGADLTGVDTAWPVLEPGVIDCVISDIKVEPTKKKNGHNLVVALKTAMPWKTREGLAKPAGFPLRDSIFLPSGSAATPESVQMSKQKLAQLKEASLGSKAGAFGAPEQYVGKPVTVRIKIEASEEYGDSNRIVAYVRRQR